MTFSPWGQISACYEGKIVGYEVYEAFYQNCEIQALGWGHYGNIVKNVFNLRKSSSLLSYVFQRKLNTWL